MVSIVLVRIQHPGNLGAIARVMKNFDVDELLLVEPACDPDCDDALARAMHGKSVLENAKVVDWDVLGGFEYLIATTAKTGTDYNIPRVPITPLRMAEKLQTLEGEVRVGIVIGPEDHGLSNEEIKRCDITVAIPSSDEYGTLNISHAVAILLYEVFRSRHRDLSEEKWPSVSAQEKRVILEKIDAILDSLEFSTPEKKETQRILWKRLVGKAMLTKREAYALIGFLRKLEG
jgi:tRNA/rRNA methyltransferase